MKVKSASRHKSGCGSEVCILFLGLLVLLLTVLVVVLLARLASDSAEVQPRELDVDRTNAEFSEPTSRHPFQEEDVPLVKKLRDDIEALKTEISELKALTFKMERKVDFYPLRDMIEANSIDELKKELLLTGEDRKEYVIGITATISRANVGMLYLIQTIQKTIAGIPKERLKDFLILVLNSDSDFFRSSSLNVRLKRTFPSEMAQGLIKVVRVDPHVYPPQLIYDPCSLYNNFDDSLSRVKWASKIAIDVSYLMELGSQLGKYYLHLEDDTPPIHNWLNLLEHYRDLIEASFTMSDPKLRKNALGTGGVVMHDPTPHPHGWWLLRLAHDKELPIRMGRMFGLLFKTNELPDFISHLRKNFDQVPVDWNTGYYIHFKNWRGRVFSLKRPIFAHIGKVSTKGQKNASSNTSRIILFGEYVDWQQCSLDNPDFVMRRNETIRGIGVTPPPRKLTMKNG